MDKQKDYIRRYKEYPEVINNMLSISNMEEFEDFISEEFEFHEDVFQLYCNVELGQSIVIGAYEGDVTQMVNQYLKANLTDEVFSMINSIASNWYVDMDEEDKFEKMVDMCNEMLEAIPYTLVANFDDTYCAGVYFLSVTQYSKEPNSA